MAKVITSKKNNLDKNFIANLKKVLKAQGDKVDAQYLCSSPSRR